MTMVPVANCPFCSVSDSLKRIDKVCPQLENDRRIYLETNNFLTTIDSHPIIPESPYFLIVPKEHYTSFAKLPRRLSGELSKHIKHVRKCVKNSFPESKKHLVTFEHGQNKHGNKVKSVYHAHWHLIFTDYDVGRILQTALGELQRLNVDFRLTHKQEINPLSALISQVRDCDYLYFSANDIKVQSIDNGNNGLYSQFFRVVMAQACSIPFIDWKNASPDELKVFGQRLYSSLPKNIGGGNNAKTN